MILADLGPVLLIAIGGIAGFPLGVVVGRVDWNQRVSYWRQRAKAKPAPPPPPTAPAPAVPAPAAPLRLVPPLTRDTTTDNTRTGT